ncbi:phage late control D family protein [Chitinimonas naiadis]
MNFSLSLDALATRAPAECVITVNGFPIDSLYPLLTEATVETGRNAPDTASLVFESRRDELGQWLVQDAIGLDGQHLFREWNRVTISAVFGTTSEEILRGFIREVKTEYPPDAGGAKVTVECQDESLQLDREHRRQSWGSTEQPSSDSLILMEIIGRYPGLSPDPQNASGRSGIIGENQDGKDIQFLQARAEDNGYELIFRGGQVYFGPVRTQQPLPQPTILVYAGRDGNCISLNVTGDAHQPDAVSFDLPGEGDASARQVVVQPDLPVMGTERAGNPAAGLNPCVWNLSGQAGGGASDNEERLRAKALAKANDADLHKVQAEGELDGTLYGHVLRPGLPVGIDGIGNLQSGIYYVDTVTHNFNAQGYRQRFKLLRNAWGDNLASLPGPGPLAAVMGAGFAVLGGLSL